MCFWDPLGDCQGQTHHGYDLCDCDGCGCPPGVGHQHREFLAILPAAKAVKRLADDKWYRETDWEGEAKRDLAQLKQVNP